MIAPIRGRSNWQMDGTSSRLSTPSSTHPPSCPPITDSGDIICNGKPTHKFKDHLERYI